MGELSRLRVYVPRKERKPGRREERLAKAAAEGDRRAQAKLDHAGDPKRFGKVHHLVFSPNGRTVAGVMVRRPDIAGMVKRDDCFVALDSFEVRDGGLLVRDEPDAYDEAACKRLGLDFERCIIWGGMNARTASGKQLGYVMDARFDERTGNVDCFCVQEGETATALVGTWEIPAAWLVGYSADFMVVRDEAANLELTGGLAGKAGEGYAAAKQGAKKAVAKADDVASKAVDKGSHALGTVIGKAKVAMGSGGQADAEGAARGSAGGVAKAGKDPHTGEKAARAVGEQLGKTKGMFSGFLREFKDASK